MAKRRQPTGKRKPTGKHSPAKAKRVPRRRRTTSEQKNPAVAGEGVHGPEPLSSGMASFRMASSPRRTLTITGVVVAVGIISVYFYVNILLELHSYLTLVFVIPLYGYVFGDLLNWYWRGVRNVEIDASGLTVTRSHRQPPMKIRTHEIVSLRLSKNLDGRTVDILLRGATSRKFLWMYFDSGPHVRIPSGPFSGGDFAEFVQRITALVPSAVKTV